MCACARNDMEMTVAHQKKGKGRRRGAWVSSLGFLSRLRYDIFAIFFSPRVNCQGAKPMSVKLSFDVSSAE